MISLVREEGELMKFDMPNKSEYVFVTKKKMPSGMTTKVSFYGDYGKNQRIAYFHIGLIIKKKRKQIDDLFMKESGKDGLKTLLFAKKALKEFEGFILEEYGNCHEKMFIVVEWDDNRRRNVYYRGLKDLGYEFSDFKGNKTLLKQIK